MLGMVSWTINQHAQPWHVLVNSDVDAAVLQEARPLPPEPASPVEIDQPPWYTAGVGINRPWRAAIVRFSDRVTMRQRKLGTI